MRSAVIVAFALALSAVAAFAADVPDDRMTPGAVNPAVRQGNIDQTICLRGWTKRIRPPEKYTYRLKRAQLHRPNSPYFVADAYLRDFEEDHRVPLEIAALSGCRDREGSRRAHGLSENCNARGRFLRP
jgi:hypothetical protein